MVTRQSTPAQPNPFALPPETNARFVLLVVASLSLAFMSGLAIAFAAGLTGVTPEVPVMVPNSADVSFLSNAGIIGSTSSSFHLLRITLPLTMIAIVLLAAILHYRRHPQRVCRQEELVPIDPVKGRELEEEVLGKAAVAGIAPAPAVVTNPSLRSQSAQVFGLPKRYIMRLDGYWRVVMAKKPVILRTVLLHEMGHIANGDVGRYYFTEALWYTTHYYALLPMIAALSFLLLQALGARLLSISSDWGSFLTRNIPAYLAVGFQLSVVWLITKAARASVLRVREYYADARADLWGAQPGLRMILRPTESTESPWKRIRGWWKLHPTAAERLATVNDPGRLFKFPLDLPFLVGFLMALVSINAFALFSDLTAGLGFAFVSGAANMMEMAEAKTSYLLLLLALGLLIMFVILAAVTLFLPVLAISYLMSSVLGLQLIRESLYDQMTERAGNGRFRQLGLVTVLWLLGLELGFLVIPVYSAMSPFVSVYPTGELWRGFAMIVWWVGSGILVWLWLFFAHRVGTQLLGHYSGVELPRLRLRIIMIITSGVLWLFLIPMAAGRVLIMFGSSSDAGPFIVLTLLSLVAGLSIYAMVWIGTWIVASRRVRCSSCKRRFSKTNVLNQRCNHCDMLMTPWLLYPSNKMMPSAEEQTTVGVKLPESGRNT